MPFPITEITATSAGHAAGLAVAEQIPRSLVRHYTRALNSLAYALDVFADPRHTPVVDIAHGLSVLGTVIPGETVIAFGDAHPQRGYLAAQVSISVLETRWCEAQSWPDRRFRSWEIANRIGHQMHADETTVEQKHGSALDLAALLIDEADLAMLHSVSGAVPVLGIVGDTRSTSRPRGQFYWAVTALLGNWLGTRPPSAVSGHA